MTAIEHVDVGPTEGDRSERPPLLFLHGLGGNASSWQAQIDAFSTAERCVAWTMPGYGGSTPLPPEEGSIAGLAEAAARLLDRLAVPRAVVIGHSLGGFVAQELALAAPDRVDRLVLVATTATFGRPGSDFNREFLAARLEPLDAGRTPADLAPDVVDGLVASAAPANVRNDAIASMSAIPVDGYRAALAALVGHDAVDRLPGLAMPTLGIAADADTTAPIRAMERLVAAIPSARLAVIDGCGHLVNSERPAAFNRLLADFIA